jgi:signal transduction histidine kinase
VASLTQLLVAFGDPAHREEAAARLAHRIGCERAALFVPRWDDGTLIPIAGFGGPRPVPAQWREALCRCSTASAVHQVTLSHPLNGAPVAVWLQRAGDGSVLAAIGGRPRRGRMAWAATGVLPIVSAIVQGEQARSDAGAARQEVLDAEARAADASRLKDDFLATLSHELRTPLNAMMGWIQMLRLYWGDEAISQRAVDVIERNARAQAQLVGDLLDVSRIITGKLRLRLSRVDLHDVVHAGCDSLRPTVDAKNLQLSIETADVPGSVIGDPDRLQQVVWNLVSNAAKFTPPGGRIEVSLRAADGFASIQVRDTGIGIAAEFVPHVFERFRQWDSGATRAYGGLGVGLAIVRHLVELHGGVVHAESEGANRGATFTVRLPCRPAMTTSSPPATRNDVSRPVRTEGRP